MIRLRLLHDMAVSLGRSFVSVMVVPYGAPKYRQHLVATGHNRMSHRKPCQHLQLIGVKGVWVAFKSDGDALYMGCDSKDNPAILYDEVIHCGSVSCGKVFNFKRGNKTWDASTIGETAHV